ncbi:MULTISPECIES: AAA family ATPase [unclassified Ectothiorhodospira]|uniref:AAA family ATPase n=1 Tax=unclassified Ectothiorhodospira TaxID=2684909 RepID=UPI001EE82706|nr:MULTISPECIES: AAA family ATPase [unclassified Ectothiorhodospira]MCG5517237.1 AAA family ATPase [Ectothiorhodospira sp. 9100]MCG5520303.1 AAA family ATPase [Ectothiorhodospira sp. 9905]
MKLNTLALSNFRRFQRLEVSFHPELTVLAARNGQGKTSVLDAATVALGTFVGAFDLGRSKSIEYRDARYQRLQGRSDNEQVFPVRIEATLEHLNAPVVRELRAKGRTTVKGATELTHLGKALMERVRGLEPVDLPLLAYYGSGRLWNAHKNISRKAVLSTSRTMGYEDCFSSASSFTQVQQWMTKATLAVLQQKSRDAYESYTLGDQIEGVQNTVDKVLQTQGWGDFHYSVQHEELAMTHPDMGVLPVSQLSDGVRAMVSLVADLAWRCAKLNPQMGAMAQQATQGIALIDEVDMHLHPEWQQTVIQTLRDAFPRIQFVVTTHSPQVLSTIRRENIRVIQSDAAGDATAGQPLASTYGEPSNNVLQAVMLVDPQPPVDEKDDLQRLTELVDQGFHDSHEAKSLSSRLVKALGEKHPQLQRLERSIERQKALRR